MSISASSHSLTETTNLASRLTHRITIQEPVYTSDGEGGNTVSWSDAMSVWAEIRSRNSGDERVFSGKIESTITHMITMRYKADIDAKMRISYNGRLFNIRRVIDVDAKGILLSIMAEEGVGQ